MSGARVTGKVKFFSDQKGLGFIRPDAGGDEVFVHRTDLGHSLSILLVDQAVTYELVDSGSRKGWEFRAGTLNPGHQLAPISLHAATAAGASFAPPTERRPSLRDMR